MAMTENIAIAVEDAPRSGEAWGAIIGGALGAAAISVILLILGSGLGLSVVSPWSGAGASATAIGVGTVVWLIVAQWVASAFGGYLTGRTRPRGEPSDEVFFRDTANGFLAWALATLLVAALVTSAISAIVGTGAQVAATVASGAVQRAAQGTASGIGQSAADPTAYLVDSLYRPAAAGAAPGASPGTAPPTAPGTAAPTAPADSNGPSAVPVGNGPAEASRADAGVGQPGLTGDLRAETGRILVAGMGSDEFPAEDATYLADQIAAHTGVAPDVAKQRVDAVVQKMQASKADAKATADATRKAAAKLSLYMFLSLIVGAFVAAAAAALGGIHRDESAVVRGVNRR